MVWRVGTKPILTYSLNTELLSQSEFQPVHFTIVGFMVVAGEVKQAVENQLSNLSVKRQPVFFRLRSGGLDGNGYIAQIRFFTGWKGEDVGWFIDVTKLSV